jgi:hypothetical protein
LEAAVTASVATDGQSVVTANLPMHGYRHTGVSNAAARTDYASAAQIQDQAIVWCGTAGGTANAITLTAPVSVAAYAAGQRFLFVAASANTAAITLQIGALAATEVLFGGGALDGYEISVGDVLAVTYSASKWHLSFESSRGTRLAGRNYMVNPHCNVAQWGVVGSVTAGNGAWIIDGWFYGALTTTTTLTREAMTPGDATPYEQPYFLRTTSASAAQGDWTLIMEDVRTLAGKPVTLTIWAKSSTANATITPSLVQVFGSGGSGSVTVNGSAQTLTTSWSPYIVKMTLADLAGKTIGAGSRLDVKLAIGAAAGLNVDIAYVQLEEGGRYTVMEPQSVADELALCRRYYQASYAQGTAAAAVTAANAFRCGFRTTLVMDVLSIQLPVVMRTIPTVTVYSTDGTAGSVHDANAVANRATTVDDVSSDHFILYSSDLAYVADNEARYHWVADARL